MRLALLLLILVAPLSAAELVLITRGPTEFVVPETQMVPLALEIKVPCSGTTFTAASTQRYSLSVSLGENESAVTLAGPSQFTVDATPCLIPVPAAHATYTVAYNFTLSRDLPGLLPHSFQIRAHLDAVGPDVDQDGHVWVNATPDYVPTLDAAFVDRIVSVPRGETFTARLPLKNLGNAPTLVTAAMEGDANLGSPQFVLPRPIPLQRPTGAVDDGSAAFMDFTFTAPSTPWDRVTYKIRLVPSALDAPDKTGEPVLASIGFEDATSKALFDEENIPGIAMPGMIVGIAAALLVVRRRP